MASITKYKSGYRAQVYVKGLRDSSIFPTKREATAWAARREIELADESKKSPSEKHTLRELLNLYMEVVSPTKRGERWEVIRITQFLNDPDFPADHLLSNLTADHFISWKQVRLNSIKGESFNRNMNLLSACMTYAITELRWIKDNPLKEVKRGPSSPHRDVVIGSAQVKGMLKALGYSPSRKVTEVRHVVAACFLLALRTGMRAGELCNLTWANVRKHSCLLPQTKTVPREVPLSGKALRVLNKMLGYDEVFVFGLKPATLDAMFRKYRERAGLEGFTFHDSRHTAATMLAKYIDVLDLCKMFGWKDPKMAMVYYNPKASDIADRLNAMQPFAKRGRSQ